MNETYVSSAPEAPKKNNTVIIVVVVLVVLCCCCVILGVGGWFYGDQLIQSLGLSVF